MVRWVIRVTYIVLRLYVGPPIQEEGDGGIHSLVDSLMEGGRSILYKGHRHIDTHNLGPILYDVYVIRPSILYIVCALYVDSLVQEGRHLLHPSCLSRNQVHHAEDSILHGSPVILQL